MAHGKKSSAEEKLKTEEKILKLWAQGLTVAQLSARFGLSRGVINRIVSPTRPEGDRMRMNYWEAS